MVERKGKVMAEVVVNGRYYMPPEDESRPTERNVMHPETNTSQIIIDPEALPNYGGQNITQYVDDTVHLVKTGVTDANLNIKPSIETTGRPYTAFIVTGVIN